MKTNKIKFIVFAMLLIFALAMTACQAGQTTPAEDTAMDEPANTPVAEASADEAPAEEPTVEVVPGELVSLTDAEGAPLLAINAEVSDDELDYIVELESGVLFGDGSLLDADAVIANFNRWFDPENEYRGDGDYAEWLALFEGFKGELDAEEKPLSAFDGIEKVNDFTVLIHLNRPVAGMLVGLSDPAFAILSPAGLANGEEIGVVR
jgi:ABC-type transport system substrate-binding protein